MCVHVCTHVCVHGACVSINQGACKADYTEGGHVSHTVLICKAKWKSHHMFTEPYITQCSVSAIITIHSFTCMQFPLKMVDRSSTGFRAQKRTCIRTDIIAAKYV